MQFRVLGDLEIEHEGRRAALGSHQQRAVLAMLVLHAGEVVSSDRLIDGLWGEQPPVTAAKTVQVYVSRLRRALAGLEPRGIADGPIVTSDHGYVLRVAEDEIDLKVFERRLVAGRDAYDRGDFAAAVSLLREGLSLWRGPPLVAFADEPFARDEIARLEELRLEAVETRIDAELALGQHSALVGELRLLTAQHPLRERLWGQRMLALHRCGRQPDALSVYRDLRRGLIDELGVEPSQGLRDLHDAIMRQDASVAPHVEPRSASPASEGAAVLPDPVRTRRPVATVAAAIALLGGVAIVLAVVAGSSHGPGRLAVGQNVVAVLSADDGGTLASVPVGVRPGPITVAAGSVWVANLDDHTITRIDPRTQQAVATTAPGGPITGMAASGHDIWLADASAGVAERLDPTVGAVAQTVRLVGSRGGAPQSTDVQEPVAISRDSLWFAHDGVLTRIDRRGLRRRATITMGDEPTAIAFGAGAAWVSDDQDNTVSRIVGDTVVERIPTGQGADGVAVGAGAVWVAQRFDGTLARIDPDSGRTTKTIAVGRAPRGVTVVGHFVWVANSGAGTLSQIDARTNRVARTVPVGGSPVAIAAVGDRLWVSIQAPAAAVTGAGGGARGGVARVDIRNAPQSLDPALAYDPLGTQIHTATCANLYGYPDTSGAAGTRLIPEVARAMPDVSRDGRRYTITIRPGYRFSPPSNAAVTARSFLRAIERSADPRWRGTGAPAFYFADIVGATAFQAGRARHISGLSATTDRLTIRLTRPATDLPLRLAMRFFCAVPDDAPVRRGGIAMLPSAGPYYVKSVIEGRQIVLARNPNYHGPRPARLDAIDIHIGRPPASAIARVTSGADDYYTDTFTLGSAIPPAATTLLQRRYGTPRENAPKRFFINPTWLVSFLALNTRRALFAHDTSLRRAIGFAIDRRALAAERGQFSLAIPADQDLAPGIPGFRNRRIYPLDHPDLARARALAGHRRRHAVLLICDVAPCPQWGAIIRHDLAAIGIQVTIRALPITRMYKLQDEPGSAWDLAWSAWGPDFPDPAGVLNVLLRGGPPNGFNSSRFDDPAYNKRLDAASRLTGPARDAAYARLDSDLSGRAAPLIPFGLAENQDFFSARIGCQVYQPVWGMDLATLCIKHR